MRFTALSVVVFLAGADAFGVSSQQSIRKPAFTSSTAIQGVKNPPANESTPAKALVSESRPTCWQLLEYILESIIQFVRLRIDNGSRLHSHVLFASTHNV